MKKNYKQLLPSIFGSTLSSRSPKAVRQIPLKEVSCRKGNVDLFQDNYGRM